MCPQLGAEFLEAQVTEAPDVFLACSVGRIGLVEVSNGLGSQVRGNALGPQFSLNEERAAWPMVVSALLPEGCECRIVNEALTSKGGQHLVNKFGGEST